MKRLATLLIAAAMFGCGSDDMTNEFPETLNIDGKGDISNGIFSQGELRFGEEVTGTFSDDFEVHAYTIDANAGSELRLEVTHQGSTRDLDPLLYIYAPTDRGHVRIARDDNSGYGEHPRIDITLRKKAEFLVIVKPERDDARGKYRLTLECTGTDCQADQVIDVPTECPILIEESIYDCLEEGRNQDRDYLEQECADPLMLHEYACAHGGYDMCYETYDFYLDQVFPNCFDYFDAAVTDLLNL